jgi:hypothetical protein
MERRTLTMARQVVRTVADAMAQGSLKFLTKPRGLAIEPSAQRWPAQHVSRKSPFSATPTTLLCDFAHSARSTQPAKLLQPTSSVRGRAKAAQRRTSPRARLIEGASAFRPFAQHILRDTRQLESRTAATTQRKKISNSMPHGGLDFRRRASAGLGNAICPCRCSDVARQPDRAVSVAVVACC